MDPYEIQRTNLLQALARLPAPTSGAQSPTQGGGPLVKVPKGAILVTNKNGAKRGAKGKRKGPKMELLATVMRPGPLFPPSYNAIPTYRVKRRFVSAEAVAISSLAFSLQRGHNQFMFATDSATLLPYVEMWRIRKISVWCINYVDNATTVTLFPVGTDIDTNNFNDRERAFACSSRSEAQPGHMVIVPARDTPLGSWHKTSTVNVTGNLFVLNVDYGGASSGNWATVTVDFDFDIVLNTFGGPPGYSRSVSGATAGTMYGADWPTASPALLLQSVNKI